MRTCANELKDNAQHTKCTHETTTLGAGPPPPALTAQQRQEAEFAAYHANYDKRGRR